MRNKRVGGVKIVSNHTLGLVGIAGWRSSWNWVCVTLWNQVVETELIDCSDQRPSFWQGSYLSAQRFSTRPCCNLRPFTMRPKQPLSRHSSARQEHGSTGVESLNLNWWWVTGVGIVGVIQCDVSQVSVIQWFIQAWDHGSWHLAETSAWRVLLLSRQDAKFRATAVTTDNYTEYTESCPPFHWTLAKGSLSCDFSKMMENKNTAVKKLTGGLSGSATPCGRPQFSLFLSLSRYWGPLQERQGTGGTGAGHNMAAWHIGSRCQVTYLKGFGKLTGPNSAPGQSSLCRVVECVFGAFHCFSLVFLKNIFFIWASSRWVSWFMHFQSFCQGDCEIKWWWGGDHHS